MATREPLSIKELAAAYNEAATKLGKPTVKTFKDRPTAEARTTAILKELKAGSKGGKRKRSDNPIDFTNVKVRLPREASLPGLLLARVCKDGGATMAQLEGVVTKYDEEQEVQSENQTRRVVRILRHLYRYNRLNLRWDADEKRIYGSMPS